MTNIHHQRKRRPPGPGGWLPGRALIKMRRQPLSFLPAAVRRFGPVMHFKAFGTRYFVLSDPELIRRVLVTQADQFIKSPAMRRSRTFLGYGLITSEDPLHKRQRAIIQPWFHAKWIANYNATMTLCAQTTVNRWTNNQQIDLHREMTRLTLAIAGRALFGSEVEQEAQAIGQAMDVMLALFNRAVYPWGRLLMRLPLKSTRSCRQAHEFVKATIESMIQRKRIELTREKSTQKPNDLLARLILAGSQNPANNSEKQTPADSQMSDQQLRDECFTLLTAGHETTANLLTFSFYLLAKYPHIADELRTEINTVAPNRPLAEEDVGKLVQLDHFISEVLRFYPPVWLMARECTQNFDAEGWTIPPKSIVMISQWVMHRDPHYWKDPETFRPDRWSEDQTHRPRFAFFPFGAGKRQCIGDSFAWQEGMLAVATILRQVKFHLLTQTRLQLEPTITLRPKGSVNLRIERIHSTINKIPTPIPNP